MRFRRVSRQVNCGGVKIGGGAPISIQSMTNTDTRDVRATLAQIRRLEEAGCDIVRCAVPDADSAAALKRIKKDCHLPVVADIHFDYRLAIAAIEAGADKIRINPGNIGGVEAVKEIVKSAKARKIPIRIGVNSGSLDKEVLAEYGKPCAEAASGSALSYISLMEKLDFDDLVISIKLTDLYENHQAHIIAASKTDHPFHIGVTEAGVGDCGKIKSAIGAGALLLNGIGDTIRVSLTGDPVSEVTTAREILGSLALRDGFIQLNSCPTCSRCRVDLESIAVRVKVACEDLEKELVRSLIFSDHKVACVKEGCEDQGIEPTKSQASSDYSAVHAKERREGQEIVLSEPMPFSNRKRITVAVMGCVVNGPGEASASDVGVACGDGRGAIFREGSVVKTVAEDEIVEELVKEVKQLCGLN